MNNVAGKMSYLNRVIIELLLPPPCVDYIPAGDSGEYPRSATRLSRRPQLRRISQDFSMANTLLPPGPKGRFLVGALPEMQKTPLEFMTECARRYGDFNYYPLATVAAF